MSGSRSLVIQSFILISNPSRALKRKKPVIELIVDYYEIVLDGKPSHWAKKKYIFNIETKKVSVQDLKYSVCDSSGKKQEEYDPSDDSIRELQDFEPEYDSINFVFAAATNRVFFDDKDNTVLNCN